LGAESARQRLSQAQYRKISNQRNPSIYVKGLFMTMTVKVKNGQVSEYKNGRWVADYGSKIIDADTDGVIVVAVDVNGQINEYKDGRRIRTYGSNASKVKISGGTVVATGPNGRMADYKDGRQVRTYG
jgi:hypothetical protein